MNNEHIKVALASNLYRSADALERLALGVTTELPTTLEELSETQAQVDAGAAIWGAVLQGFLVVPEIVEEVEGVAGNGFTEVNTAYGDGVVCVNLFFSVMSGFIYPLGESVAPYLAGDDENVSEARYAAGRKLRMTAEATGCRIIARLIEQKAPPPVDDIRWSLPATMPKWANRFKTTVRTIRTWKSDGTIHMEQAGPRGLWRVDESDPIYIQWTAARTSLNE